MPDARWRVYPAGLAASVVRSTGSALLSVPLIAALMILPFLAARHVAGLGGFGTGATGGAWMAWGEYALGVAVLLLTVCPALVALLNYLRTVLLLGALRRAVQGGARAREVPHPDQWQRAASWSGTSLIVSALLATAVLAFPVVLTGPVRAWVESLPLTQDWRLVGVPVIAIGLVGVFQPRRKRAVAELERRWPEAARQAAESAAKGRLPQQPRDSDGDPVNPTQIQRRPLDTFGDQLNTAGIVLTLIAVVVALITFGAADAILDGGTASTRGPALLVSSSLLLLVIAIALYIVGAVLQNVAQIAEQRELFAAARNPAAAPPSLGAIARNWSVTSPRWANFSGLLGALVLLLALPGRLVGYGQAQTWATIGLAAAVLMLIAAVVLDVAAEQRTREPRTLVLQRWPTPDPAAMAKWSQEQAEHALEADVQRYDAGPGTSSAGPWPASGRSSTPPGHGDPMGPAGNGMPPADPTLPPPARTPYPPAAGGRTPPAAGGAATPPSPPPASGRRRGWGLPKKLRGRGLGDLYR